MWRNWKTAFGGGTEDSTMRIELRDSQTLPAVCKSVQALEWWFPCGTDRLKITRGWPADFWNSRAHQDSIIVGTFVSLYLQKILKEMKTTGCNQHDEQALKQIKEQVS